MSLKNIGILALLIALAMLIGFPKPSTEVVVAKEEVPASAMPQTGMTSGKASASHPTAPAPAAQFAPLGNSSEIIDDVPPGAEVLGSDISTSASPPLPGQ